MRVVLVCSITGQNIRNVVDNICGASSQIFCVRQKNVPKTLEDYLTASADPYLTKLGSRIARSYADVLRLPRDELIEACRRAFDAALADLVKASGQQKRDVGLLALHPVLYHALFQEFIAPYDPLTMRAAVEHVGASVDLVLSIHDDVYDTYAALLGKHKLFAASGREDGSGQRVRRASDDIQEEMLLLNWRSTELTVSKMLASGIGARHFLFHQKGHLQSLVKVIEQGGPSIYLSHPISQPRRDIESIASPGKSDTTDHERGIELRGAINAAARRLRMFAAVVEPTAIDEYRIDLSKLDVLVEKSLPDSAVLPPLRQRWPLVDGDHLNAGCLPPNIEGTPFVTSELRPFRNSSFGGEGLGILKSAVQLLEKEIQRQVNVRDHGLADQCDLVVVFRPFSKPDSDEPTGGVAKEIEVVYRKLKLGKIRCKPAMIVLHPAEDERRRREIAFHRNWDSLADTYLRGSPEKLQHVKTSVLQIVLEHSGPVPDAAERIAAVLQQIEVVPRRDESSMQETRFSRAEKAVTGFADELVNRTKILVSDMERAVVSLGEYVRILPTAELTDEVQQCLQEALSSYGRTVVSQRFHIRTLQVDDLLAEFGV